MEFDQNLNIIESIKYIKEAAGKPGAITLATNVAGRATDIRIVKREEIEKCERKIGQAGYPSHSFRMDGVAGK